MLLNTARHLEVERKFDVDDAATPPSFADVATTDPVSESLDAVYFDTSTHDLASRRITLRRRTGGADAGWHLKLPAGPDARTEVRAALGADPADVPVELVDVVLAIVRDRPLGPVARITTNRAVQLLRGADGAVLAEFCDDRVTAHVTAGEKRWREWEIELAGGSTDMLDRLSDRLLSAGAVPAAHGSKLSRALGDAPPPDVHLDPVHRAVAEQVAQLLAWDRAVRADTDDAVHQLRVTIRKIRSLCRGAAVDGELRWLAALLGVARDAEVLGQRYRHELARLPTELVRGPVVQRLVDEAAERYRAGLGQALAAMRSARYFRLLDDLDALVCALPVGAPAAVTGPGVSIDAGYRRVRKAAKTAHAAPDADRDEALHRIRKAAKRLRYTAGATDAALVAERAKVIQTLLGDHQDSVVSRAHLLAEAEAAHAAGEDTFTYGLLYRQEEGLALACRARLDHALDRLAEACSANELACKPDSVPR